MVSSTFLINVKANYLKIVDCISFFMAVMGMEEDLQIKDIMIWLSQMIS